MKMIMPLLCLALLTACQKSVDQQFSDMCDAMKSDPDAPTVGEDECRNPAAVSEDTKVLIIDMNEKQKERLEISQ